MATASNPILPTPGEAHRIAITAAQCDWLDDTIGIAAYSVSGGDGYPCDADFIARLVNRHLDEFARSSRLGEMNIAACYLTAWGY